jgi:hypothetical protein
MHITHFGMDKLSGFFAHFKYELGKANVANASREFIPVVRSIAINVGARIEPIRPTACAYPFVKFL